jgi:tetratricopeptide (TPR) repeat protein
LVALFGKKKGDGEGGGGDSKSAIKPNPAKAESFFKHAQAMHDAANYEYAVTLWLQGVRQDPTSMNGLEGFYDSCQSFLAKRGKFGPTKEQEKPFGGKSQCPQVEKVLVALLNWGTRPLDSGAGVKAIDAMTKVVGIDLDEQIFWIGEKVLDAGRRDKKAKKDTFVRLKDLFKEAGIFTLAVKSGEVAVEIDPNDSPLQAEVRNLSAQATMSSGGYEDSGQEGGFRANIRDTSKQRQLEEEERIVKTEDVIERALLNAKADFEARPDDASATLKYVRTLLDRGTPADEKLAYTLLMKAYEQLHEFRFRQQAGEIKMRQGRRKVAQLKKLAMEQPDNREAAEMYAKGQRALLKLEAEEFELRVKALPTDLLPKFELGKRRFALGEYEEAIALFQKAKDDPKRRSECLNYLGRSFLELGWQDEAIGQLRDAINAHPVPGDDTHRELRYGLMSALEAKAREAQDLEAAEEAGKIASSIAIEQISFKDIRERRAALQELVKEIRAGATS